MAKREGEGEGERREIEREKAEEAIERKGFLGKSDKCQRRITMLLTLTRTVETVILWRDRRRYPEYRKKPCQAEVNDKIVEI